MSYAGRRVMVTGAGGFIGRWVARALTEAGAELTLAVRRDSAARPVLESWGAKGTIVSGPDLPDIVALAKPDVIFNLAGYGVDPAQRDEGEAEAINTLLPPALAKALVDIPSDWPGPRLVHAGSALEYGTAAGDLNEATLPMPTTLYGKTKLTGTQCLLLAADAHQVDVRVARLFTVYGPGELPGRLLPSLLRAAESGDELPLTEGTQRRDFTYVADVADGLLRLGLAKGSGVVNLATGVLTPVRSFIETAARVLGIAPGRLKFGALPARPEEMQHDPVNVLLLQRLTDWTPPTNIEAGIRATRAFLPNNSTEADS